IVATSAALFAVPAFATDIAAGGTEHGWNADYNAPNNDANAIYVTDVDDATGWTTGGGGGNWTDDLGSAITVDSVRVVAIGNCGQTYRILASDDVTFATFDVVGSHTFT